MAKKRIQKKTYTEFLSWLEGVESMQEEGWTPNEVQWKKIREMLNTVKPDTVESKKTVQQISTPTNPVARFVEHPGGPTIQPIVQQTSSFDKPPPQRFSQPAAVPSGVKRPLQPPSDGKPNILDPGNMHNNDEFV